MYELWAGERLASEKSVSRYRKPGRPISVPDDCQGWGVGARDEPHGHDPGPRHTPAVALQPLRRRARRGAAGQDAYPVRAAGAGSAAHRAADCR